jgi:hypothetical protein
MECNGIRGERQRRETEIERGDGKTGLKLQAERERQKTGYRL